jgi:DMSO/TMAO reductase YedYZ molybdopterin-dependent catalytic subunit
MFSRRDFLRNMSGAALVASAANPLLSWATDAQIAIPGKEDLIVRSYRFFDLETPVEYFRTWLTPAQYFFVRNHMHEPSTIDPAEWKLSIGGEVGKPYALTLAELGRLEAHSVVNTLHFRTPRFPECSGGKVPSARAASVARACGICSNAPV